MKMASQNAKYYRNKINKNYAKNNRKIDDMFLFGSRTEPTPLQTAEVSVEGENDKSQVTEG